MQRYEAAYEAITQSPSRTWRRDGITYELTKVFKQKRGPREILSVDLRASRRGRVVYDDRNNFPNPPLQAVVDGAPVDDPYLALKQRLEANVAQQTNGYTEPHIKRVGDTDSFTGDTLTVYAVDDGTLDSTADDLPWATAQAGSGALTSETDNPNDIAVGVGPSFHLISLSYLRFDTSSLVSGDVINSYTLSLFGTGSSDDTDYDSTIQARVHPGYGTGDPDTGDWVNCATTWSGLTLFATLAVTSWNSTADTQNSFTSQGASASINIDGNTDIVVGLANVSGGRPAEGLERIFFRSSEQSGTGSDPVLVISFTAGPRFITPDPVVLALTVPSITLTGGIEVISPDPVVIELTVPDVHLTDLIHYERIEQQSWSGDIFNRIQAGVSPYSPGSEAVLWTDPGPYILSAGESVDLFASSTDLVAKWTGHTRDVDPQTSPYPMIQSTLTQAFTTPATTFNVAMPATVNDDDLLIVLVSLDTAQTAAMPAPIGWTSKVFLTGSLSTGCFVRLASGDEGGSVIPFVAGTASKAVVQVYRLDNWFGNIGTDGIVVGPAKGSASSSHFDPYPFEWGWGEIPTLVIASYSTPTGNEPTSYPDGYTNPVYVEAGSSLNLVSASRQVSGANSENPGSFEGTASAYRIMGAIAIRGVSDPDPTPVSSTEPSGSSGQFTVPYDATVGGTTQTVTNIQVTGLPVIKGDEVVVEVNDIDSQDTHGLSTYTNPATLFRSPGDALTYANLVLSRYKDRHPVMRLAFTATKTTAHYAQVKERRVGDRVTLIANNNSGLGISQDFFIESIHLRASQGKTFMEVEYELSPVLE